MRRQAADTFPEPSSWIWCALHRVADCQRDALFIVQLASPLLAAPRPAQNSNLLLGAHAI